MWLPVPAMSVFLFLPEFPRRVFNELLQTFTYKYRKTFNKRSISNTYVKSLSEYNTRAKCHMENRKKKIWVL
jgi:hypothetical protein